MAQPLAGTVHAPDKLRHSTGDLFKQVLANQLDERIQRIKSYISQTDAVSRDELARFIWGTGRKIYEVIAPHKDGADRQKREEAWSDARGLLKELIHWEKFTPQQFHEPCIQNVLEEKVVDILDAYKNYVLTGEIKTKWTAPKLLGETDEIVCVDKPCLYTCTYGSSTGPNKFAPPPRQLKGKAQASASILLNGPHAEIQLHEFLAVKYNYECAAGTREFWNTEKAEMDCICGECDYCACTQSGCCNRLDKETSGVMIAAKTKGGFREVRRQFKSSHSLEEGGTEKYYLALCHGNVQLPTEDDNRNKDWKHTLCNGRGRIEVSCVVDKKAFVWDDQVWVDGQPPNPVEHSGAKQWALTFYEPVAWFEHKEDTYTFVHLQIITGRTHQIRFHMQQVGHSLVGDSVYGAPLSDRSWCQRVFLHSYQTKFREPFTDRWFEATSPLPQDLGGILASQFGAPIEVVPNKKFKSRRVHEELSSLLKQYNPAEPLLYTHDAPKNKDEVMRLVAMQAEQASSKQDWRRNQQNQNDGQSWKWKSNWSGGAGWNSKSSWKDEKWKENGKWGGEWGASEAQSGEKRTTPEENTKTIQDDDDDWGGWKNGKNEPKDNAVAEAKKPRVDFVQESHPVQQPLQSAPAAQALQQPAQVAQAPAPPSGGWKRMESRSQPGVYYYWHQAYGKTQPDPPAPWEVRQSRSRPDVSYYWNPQTGVTSPTKPEV